jgi:hypothetical protein
MHSGATTDGTQGKESFYDAPIEVIMWLRLVYWRRLFVVVLTGLMPMLLYGDVPRWYRWLGIGATATVFLLWSLPSRGNSLIEDNSSTEKRKLLLFTYLILFFTIISSIAICFISVLFIKSEILFLINMPSKDWFSLGCILFSGVSSTLELIPRRVEFDRKNFLFFEYRVSLSCLVWSLFTLPAMLLILIGKGLGGERL